MEPILLVLGPSGAGKTRLSDYMAAENGMIHINLDQDGDAATKERVKKGWDVFETKNPAIRSPDPFVSDIRRRIVGGGARGAVVTCTSGVMPSVRPGATGWHLSKQYLSTMLNGGIRTVVLFGSQADCMKSFLEREESTGRRIGGTGFWLGNNGAWYDQNQFSVQEFGGLIVQSFANGQHRELADKFEEIRRRFLD